MEIEKPSKHIYSLNCVYRSGVWIAYLHEMRIKVAVICWWWATGGGITSKLSTKITAEKNAPHHIYCCSAICMYGNRAFAKPPFRMRCKNYKHKTDFCSHVKHGQGGSDGDGEETNEKYIYMK